MMNRKALFWPLAAVLLTACEKGLGDIDQAFLLVASIFGLDYYVKLITRKINGKHTAQ